MQPSEHAIPYLLDGAFHRLAYVAWGDPASPPVVCVHGLSRQGRDFDVLAQALAPTHRVICPDLPGRGRSSWLPDAALYAPPSYVVALAHLLATLEGPVDWVGTSLGGICGMLVAAASGNPIRRMVLNDIGPFLPKAALARIAAYVGDVPDFTDMAALESFLRRVHAPFGALSDAQWAQMAAASARPVEGGRVALHYDPALTLPLRRAAPADVDMWAIWDRHRGAHAHFAWRDERPAAARHFGSDGGEVGHPCRDRRGACAGVDGHAHRGGYPAVPGASPAWLRSQEMCELFRPMTR